jgi:hypothetical protein
MLVKYIVVSNNPFSEVEVPEFAELMQYTYTGPGKLNMPSARTIRQRVLDLSGDIMKEIKEMFSVSLSQICHLSSTAHFICRNRHLRYR